MRVFLGTTISFRVRGYLDYDFEISLVGFFYFSLGRGVFRGYKRFG